MEHPCHWLAPRWAAAGLVRSAKIGMNRIIFEFERVKGAALQQPARAFWRKVWGLRSVALGAVTCDVPQAHLQPEHMTTSLGTIIIYARDMQKTAAFYREHFGFKTTGEVLEGLIELHPPHGGAAILIHQAAKSVKLGQAGVKLSFHVPDVEAFALAAAKKGLTFGAVHEANGYQFANAKDPDRNPVSISSRAFRAPIAQ